MGAGHHSTGGLLFALIAMALLSGCIQIEYDVSVAIDGTQTVAGGEAGAETLTALPGPRLWTSERI